MGRPVLVEGSNKPTPISWKQFSALRRKMRRGGNTKCKIIDLERMEVMELFEKDERCGENTEPCDDKNGSCPDVGDTSGYMDMDPDMIMVNENEIDTMMELDQTETKEGQLPNWTCHSMSSGQNQELSN